MCYRDEKLAAMAHWGILGGARVQELQEVRAKDGGGGKERSDEAT